MRTIRLMAALCVTAVLGNPTSAQEVGGTLKLALHPEPPSAVAGISTTGASEMLYTKIYDSLFSYDFDLTPRGLLAESWSVSEDGLILTVKLKEGVRWHDGEAFDAEDVVTSYKVHSSENAILSVLSALIASVEATGPYEVVFTTKEPMPALIYGLAPGNMPIIPDHIYGDDAPFRGNPANEQPIGTGPFKFAEWEKGRFVRLVRNEDYHVEGQPYLDELYFVMIPDSQGRAIAFEQGTIDVVSASILELHDVDRLASLSGAKSSSQGWEFFSPHAFLWVNHDRPPFDDVTFRQALNYAMDKDFIRDVIFSGWATPPRGPIGSRTRFFDEATEAYDYDPQRARQLISESSYDGREIELLPLAVGSSWSRLAEYQVQALKDVGINAKLSGMDVGALLQRFSERDYDMGQVYLYQRADPAIGVARNFLSTAAKSGSPWTNVAMYRDQEVDALLNEAAATRDPVIRNQLYSRAQRRIAEQAVVVWLAELEFPTIYKSKVRNLISNAAGLSSNFADVWIEQ